MFEPYGRSPRTQNYMRQNQPKMFKAIVAMRIFFVVTVLACAGIIFVRCSNVLDRQLDREVEKLRAR